MDERKRVLVVLPLDERQREKLETAMPEGIFTYIPVKKVRIEDTKNANIIIGNVPVEFVQGLEQLEWLQLNNAGTEGYGDQGILCEHTILTNATGAYGTLISEHMIGMLLSIQKKLMKYHTNQMVHRWNKEGYVDTIEGSTTLVIGLGDIGSTFARKMNALGSRILGIRRRDYKKPDFVDEMYHMDQLEEALKQADIVALCVPGYEQTKHIMNKERLLLMKKEAIIINVGRGSAIHTEDLCEVLNVGHLKGVCLDVTDPEPLPIDHRLWEYDNVLITPHVSGPYGNEKALEIIVEISANNLNRYANGKSLINEIDFKTGYCK